MRSDLARVFNAKAHRHGDHDSYVKGRIRDLEGLPHFEGIADARRRGYGRKRRNQHWSLAKRWLQAQAGRRWDDVFSEICLVSDLRSASTRVLREHILGIVDTKTYRDDEGVLRVAPLGYEAGPLCVDPEGILRHIPRSYRRRHFSAPRLDRVVVDNDTECLKLDGIWYEVRYRPTPDLVEHRGVNAKTGEPYRFLVAPRAWDVVERRSVQRDGRFYTKRSRYAFSKRVLSRKELRRLGLTNSQ